VLKILLFIFKNYVKKVNVKNCVKNDLVYFRPKLFSAKDFFGQIFSAKFFRAKIFSAKKYFFCKNDFFGQKIFFCAKMISVRLRRSLLNLTRTLTLIRSNILSRYSIRKSSFKEIASNS